MSNVIGLPDSERDVQTASVAQSAAQVLASTPHSHAVQFYEDEQFLVDTVADFLRAGVEAGDSTLLIATVAHGKAFIRKLEALGAPCALHTGKLTILDAHETLAKFMVSGMPDRDLFLEQIARVIRNIQDAAPGARLRAYGEMVDVLWQDGNSRAAIRLEELWNELGKTHSFSLLCAYVMGNFYKEGDTARFLEVCRNHSHVLPTESFSELGDAHARLREISLLQQRARALENEIEHRKQLECALRDALQDRVRVEEELRSALVREREACARAEASDAYKEVFLGILGHDLRNPLNTILTTARLMVLRPEPADVQRRLARVVSSGERMARMISQILDVTRARLSEIPISTPSEHDLVSIVNKISEETLLAHPERTIDIRAEGPCLAYVDADRFEEVISNLLGNAVTHGARDAPISVEVFLQGEVAVISVHNFGPAIDEAFMPMLFDPFKRAGKPQGRSEGLGLGLYISERIVSAHGGKIQVKSSPQTGTTFEIILPRK